MYICIAVWYNLKQYLDVLELTEGTESEQKCVIVFRQDGNIPHCSQKHISDPKIGGVEDMEQWDVHRVHTLHQWLFHVGIGCVKTLSVM